LPVSLPIASTLGVSSSAASGSGRSSSSTAPADVALRHRVEAVLGRQLLSAK